MTTKDFSYNARLRNLTIRQLRSLAALSARGSVTAASNQLGLTQPAVTQQLRQLQELAGLPLVQRTADGMVLTSAGSEVLALAERIEAAITDCQHALDLLAGRSAGTVSIGAVSTAKYFVPHAIAAFSKRYPKIEVKLTIGNREELRRAMHGYDLDFAVMGRPPADIAVDIRQLGANPHIIIAQKGHWLEKDRGLNAADLAHETFLSRERGSGTRMLMEGFFQKADLEPTIGMEMSSNETIKQAVIAGLGIAFISAHTVATELIDGRLVALDVAGLPLVRQWYAMRRSDKVLLPPAQAMFDFIGSEGANYLPIVRLPDWPNTKTRVRRSSLRGK